MRRRCGSSRPRNSIIRRARDRANLMRLWEVCQTPDFRKTTQDEHARLIGAMFEHLTQGDRRLPEDWMNGQFAGLDRIDGDIDTLSTRLARVRTLAYVANRADWLADPPSWQGRARALEDRLSDTLHQSLMQRFVDRRTSALLRSLSERSGPILGGIDNDGAVTVEGHLVGRLAGFHFEPERGATALENRALRSAVERVVAPEVARRLGALASESDEAFALRAGGGVDWRGEPAGEIAGGTPFAPRVRLIGEFGAEPQRERAARRLEAFAAAEASRRLAALKHLKEAIGDGRLKGLARGLAYQLVEQAGALDRRAAESRIRALSRHERRMLKGLGVRFGAFSLYLPSLLTPESQLVGAAYAELASPGWRPDAGGLDRAAPARSAARGPVLSGPARGRRARGSDRRTGAAGHARPHGFARGRRRRGPDAGASCRSRVGARECRAGAARSWLRPGPQRRRRGGGSLAPSRGAGGGAAFGNRNHAIRGARGAEEAELSRGPAGAPSEGPASPRRGARRLVTEDACRIDVWLWRARFFKTRSLAARIVEEGGVRLTRGGARTPVHKASRTVRSGDVLAFAQGPRWLAVKVEALGERRGPAPEARTLYSVMDEPGDRAGRQPE